MTTPGWGTVGGFLGYLILIADGVHDVVGGWVASALSGRFEVDRLLPFAAGNFIYIAAADLMPELTEYPGSGRELLLTGTFVPALAVLLVVAVVR